MLLRIFSLLFIFNVYALPKEVALQVLEGELFLLKEKCEKSEEKPCPQREEIYDLESLVYYKSIEQDPTQ